MKYLLKVKNSEGTVYRELEYKTLMQLAADLKTTYCSVRKNLQYSLKPEMKRGTKLSQVLFDKQYQVSIVDPIFQE